MKKAIILLCALALAGAAYPITATKAYVDGATNATLTAAKAYTNAKSSYIADGTNTIHANRTVVKDNGLTATVNGATSTAWWSDVFPHWRISFNQGGSRAKYDDYDEDSDVDADEITFILDEGDDQWPGTFVLKRREKTMLATTNDIANVYTKTESDAAYYAKSSGNQLEYSVATISAHLNAEDARFVVTNYDSATRTPEAYVEIKVSNDWLRVWSEARRWNELEPWKTNVTAQLATKAERAWGIYDSETGGYSPDGFTQISSSNILIASGMAYQRTVTPFNSLWILQCNQGTAQLGGDTNGYFRIKDGDGNTQFEIVKGNRIELGADASGITVDSVISTSLVTIPYSVVANEHPTLQVCTDLGAGNWKAEGEAGCPATVRWTGTSGAYVAHVTAPNNLSQMFFKATYLGGSDTIINNAAPVKMQYIYIGNSKYAIGYATINGTGVMTLTPAN